MVILIRRLIIAGLISLCLCFPAYAGMRMGIVGGDGSGGTPSYFCGNATTTTNGTVGVLCEDLQGSGDCLYYTEPDSESCRNQWIDSGAPSDSDHKFTISDATQIEYIKKDIGDPVAALSVFTRIKFVALPTASNRNFIRIQNNNTDYCLIRISPDGTIGLVSGASASVVNKVSVGGIYSIWARYDSSSNCEVCWSESTTKGTGNYCATVAAQAGTVDSVAYTNTWTSTTNHSIEVKDIFIDTDAIGSNP